MCDYKQLDTANIVRNFDNEEVKELLKSIGPVRRKLVLKKVSAYFVIAVPVPLRIPLAHGLFGRRSHRSLPSLYPLSFSERPPCLPASLPPCLHASMPPSDRPVPTHTTVPTENHPRYK
jgi:hypothetical protein